MSHEAQVHTAQTSILRELLFQPEAGFTELQKPTQLSSDHFNFHIKRLVALGFVQKSKPGKYTLTSKGKEYANKLDTDNNTIERQPKIAVLLVITRTKNGKTQFLFQERLKHPYYGYFGFPTGKIRWGETIVEAAARELKEETGLSASCRFLGIYHEHSHAEASGEILEDKVFLAVHCSDIQGTLIEKFEGGKNSWHYPQELEKHKTYKSFPTELAVAEGIISFKEETHLYSTQEF